MIRRKKVSQRDLEKICVYMDGSLSAIEREKFDARLAKSPSLQETLREFTQLNTSLQSMALKSAPRNFTLTTAEARAIKPRRALYPAFSYAGLTALLLAVLMFTSEFIFTNFSIPHNSGAESAMLREAPMQSKDLADDAQGLLFTWGGGAYGMGGGGGESEPAMTSSFGAGMGGGVNIFSSEPETMLAPESIQAEPMLEEDSSKTGVEALILGLREDQAGEILEIYPSPEDLAAKQAVLEEEGRSALIHPLLKFGLLSLGAVLLLIALLLFLRKP